MTHKVIGEGHMKIPNGDDTYFKIHAWHTQTMLTTVLSLGEVVQQHRKLNKYNAIFCNKDEQSGCVNFHGRVSSYNVIMNTKHHNKKASTLPLVPTSSTSGIKEMQDKVHYMKED
eukprot:15348088-Ditylum_brightwellii.AAC.1